MRSMDEYKVRRLLFTVIGLVALVLVSTAYKAKREAYAQKTLAASWQAQAEQLRVETQDLRAIALRAGIKACNIDATLIDLKAHRAASEVRTKADRAPLKVAQNAATTQQYTEFRAAPR